jgi:hypothetical protein
MLTRAGYEQLPSFDRLAGETLVRGRVLCEVGPGHQVNGSSSQRRRVSATQSDVLTMLFSDTEVNDDDEHVPGTAWVVDGFG